ncbi:MAG: triose-phosphate isomerase [Patescibacteria group bacterium]|nr:triose-phosphate isomerase [Patescibacteria group bacterium]MDE1944485.1 triose-phosphate isomerase [Patescibacteria group bacterium]MDE1944742.1 triose-phosphate isomerase [Patescibacteria group bacterium]MDE2057286.1 triose-phosphate isomerase [Patescibacteria group bacterium]
MLIIANWKAYVEDVPKAAALASAAKRLARTSGVELVLAPPAPFLGLLARASGPVAFAAQDVSATTGGAKTGEVTAASVRAAGARYAIVGHSERRAAGDTDTVVAEKLRHALAQKLVPILCVGETARDGDGRYLARLRESLASALGGLTAKEAASVIIAYEPVWAIGKTAADAIPPADLAETALYLRKVLAEFLPGRSAARAAILYGGSVEPENARALAGETGVAGFLVGHASVEPETFAALVRAVA